ncbi:ATP-dependent Clp protease ATP-binding subunit [Patescibacteria group bacterium]
MPNKKKPSIFDKFSTRLKGALTKAQDLADQSGDKYIDSGHLLYGMVKEEGSIAREILQGHKITPQRLSSLLDMPKTDTRKDVPRLKDKGGVATKPPDIDITKLSEESKKALEIAVQLAYKFKHKYVGTEHLLYGILTIKDSRAQRLLKRAETNIDQLRQQLTNVFKSTAKFPSLTDVFSMLGQMSETEENNTSLEDGAPPPDMMSPMAPSPLAPGMGEEKKSPLEMFGKDLTDKESQKRIDPVIGRAEEIRRIVNILGRRSKNNPVLIGEAGVGKTAIVEGLAKQIASDEVPEYLQGKKIVTLDLPLLVAGTMYRGEFEGRLKQVIEEVSKNSNVILFIDEIHTMVGAGTAGGGTMDAANIIKPALARGEFRVVGATTLDEYRKHIEKDSALERRFQPVLVEESTTDETREILEGVRANYEAFHRIAITPEAIDAAIKLSERYLPDRFLPDKALDLIDEAASHLKIDLPTSSDYKEAAKLEEKLLGISKDKQGAVGKQDFKAAYAIREAEKAVKDKLAKLQAKQQQRQKEMQGKITANDIAKVIHGMTKIPLAELEQENARHLLDLERKLNGAVIGQERAIREIAQAIKRSRAGVSDPRRPLGSFIFLGPTGVGKTELAKVIAREVYNNEDALIKIDMSEFMEKFNVSRLVGAAAGYVGYEEGGKLTEEVRRRPYSVVLFDEIEKAHPDVFNILLQILEDGVLTDNTGRKVNFKNTIVIMTSNIGTRDFTNAAAIGFQKEEAGEEVSQEEFQRLESDVIKELEKQLSPELLNRIDKTLVFKPLSKQAVRRIVRLQLAGLQDRLAEERRIKMKASPSAIGHLAKKGFDPKRGARPIRRTIQEMVEDMLAEKILAGEIKEDQQLLLTKDGDIITIEQEK